MQQTMALCNCNLKCTTTRTRMRMRTSSSSATMDPKIRLMQLLYAAPLHSSLPLFPSLALKLFPCSFRCAPFANKMQCKRSCCCRCSSLNTMNRFGTHTHTHSLVHTTHATHTYTYSHILVHTLSCHMANKQKDKCDASRRPRANQSLWHPRE